MVCSFPGTHVKICDEEYVVPSTMTLRFVGFVVMVMLSVKPVAQLDAW